MESQPNEFNINLQNYKDYDKAILEMQNFLQKSKVFSSGKLSNMICKFLKNQLHIGLGIRQELLSGQINLNKSILTNCVTDYGDLSHHIKDQQIIQPSEIDYCIYFIYQIISSMCKKQNFMLNSFRYLNVYYDIQDLLFDIVSKENENFKVCENYQYFEEHHVKWILKKRDNLQIRAIQIRFQHNSSQYLGQNKEKNLVQIIEEVKKIFQIQGQKKQGGKESKVDKSVKIQIDFGIHLTKYYELHNNGISILKTCQYFAEYKLIDQIVQMVSIEKNKSQNLVKLLIDSLIQKSTFYVKTCEKICDKLEIDLQNFPQIILEKKNNAMYYYLGQYLNKKEKHPDYRGLNRIEEFFYGLNDMLCILCKELIKQGRVHEAKGIYLRNNLTDNIFIETFKESGIKIQGIASQLNEMKYDKSKDFIPIQDLFEPISISPLDHIRLPEHIEVQIIHDEENIELLKVLIGQKYIGVDAEWRPQVHQFHQPNGVAIFQVACETHSFIIDMIALKNNKILDEILINIFTNSNSTIIGFGFQSDITQFKKTFKEMKFYTNITNFIDAQNLYKSTFQNFQDEGGSSLAVVCERLIGQKLCKNEQCSNWENRPLRFSQQHYAALDAWILIQVTQKIIQILNQDRGDELAKIIYNQEIQNFKFEEKEIKQKKKDKKKKFLNGSENESEYENENNSQQSEINSIQELNQEIEEEKQYEEIDEKLQLSQDYKNNDQFKNQIVNSIFDMNKEKKQKQEKQKYKKKDKNQVKNISNEEDKQQKIQNCLKNIDYHKEKLEFYEKHLESLLNQD